jgi:hypothetical protein
MTIGSVQVGQKVYVSWYHAWLPGDVVSVSRKRVQVSFVIPNGEMRYKMYSPVGDKMYLSEQWPDYPNGAPFDIAAVTTDVVSD